MLGLVVELIVSWLLLRYLEKTDLSALGIVPTKKRMENFAFGLLASAITCTIYYLAVGYITEGNWTTNEGFSFQSFFTGSWWSLKSVLFEELIFRGALLYILIRRLGLVTGCFISAVCFGIYHWFSYNIFGDIFQMVMILVITGIAGLMFAFSFGLTRSLYLPIGLHYGWNLIAAVIFSNGPLGEQMLILDGAVQRSGPLSIGVTIFPLVALPGVVVWYLRADWKEQQSNS